MTAMSITRRSLSTSRYRANQIIEVYMNVDNDADVWDRRTSIRIEGLHWPSMVKRFDRPLW